MAGVVEPKDQVVDRDLVWRHPADVGQPLGNQPFMFALGSGCVELAEVRSRPLSRMTARVERFICKNGDVLKIKNGADLKVESSVIC